MDEAAYNKERIKNIMELSIRWIASDLALAYDNIFQFPYRSTKVIQAGIREFVLLCNEIPLEAPDTISAGYFEDLLHRWQGQGEDVERILYWFASIHENFRKTPWAIKGPENWRRAFYWWSNEPSYRAQFLAQDRFDAFMKLVHRDFTIPYKKNDVRRDYDDERWVEDASYRSDWDNWLWEQFFEEVYVSPVTYFYGCDWVTLLRQFWKKHRNFLSPKEQEELFFDMQYRLENSHLGQRKPKPEQIAPLDQALDLANIPDFDKYKRDWEKSW